MNFLAAPTTIWLVALVCAIGGLLWIWLEFRRNNRRQWPVRILATLLAALAMAALGLRPAWIAETSNIPPAPEEAALWTPSIGAAADQAAPRGVARERVFALLGATGQPDGALVIPDLAFLARGYPNVKTLHIFGDGVHAFDAEALRRIRTIVHLNPENSAGPAFGFVRTPAQVSVGDPIVVQVRVQGIISGSAPLLALTAPDGTKQVVTLAPAPDGVATVSLRSPPAVTTGRFVWQLELRAGEAGEVLAREKIGVSVVQPIVPRILVLEAAPRFDTGRLRRWLGERGAELTVRTQLGRDRYRISTAHGSREASETIDAGTLAGFDVVIADAGALVALGESEREALRSAINDEGLGVLMLADQTLIDAASAPAGSGSPDEFFSPWRLLPGAVDAANEGRLSRLRWLGSEANAPEPLPVPNFEIERGARQQPLVRDGQDRTLVAITGRGRGRVALSLVTETWRWTQLADSSAFAAYWSFLLSEVARRDSAGRWSVASNRSGPHFVNEPLVLRWSGAAERAPLPTKVSAEGSDTPESLALAQSPVDARDWQANYWPRRAGWHQVAAPGGAQIDFYVSESSDWPVLQAMRRRAATARIAASYIATDATTAPRPSTTPVEFGRWWAYAILFACLTYLWSEARSLRQSSPISQNQ